MAKKHGKRYSGLQDSVDPEAFYSPEEAISWVKKGASAKFNETVEFHLRLNLDARQADQQVRGVVVLPHGLGKKLSVVVFATGEGEKIASDAGADFVGSDELIKKVNDGWTDFDVALATPDMMTKIGKLGRVLGRKGLMPSPRTGTVVNSNDLARAVEQSKAGRVEYRLDKFGIIHTVIGKSQFEEQQLVDNFTALMEAILEARPDGIKGGYIKSLSLSSTMGPGIKIDLSALLQMEGAAN